ncbi:hypothetical protein [Flavobacterium sp.]|uniref:hypothetical protein n=1 Tax=Flavobacterium sp. TaxID=239 RepID=UPI003D14D2E3
MENAVVLKPGKVVKKSNFIPKSLKFDLDGFVIQFAIGKPENIYKHVNKAKYNLEDLDGIDKQISAGYYLQSEFLKYLANIITSDKLKEFALKDSDLLFAKDGDQIEVIRLHIKSPYNYFYKLEKFIIDYKEKVSILDYNENIIIPVDKIPTVIDINKEVMHNAHLFYTNRIPIVNSFNDDAKDSSALLITKISLMINMISSEIFPLFTILGNGNLDSYVNTQINEWLSGDILNIPSLDVLNEFYENISDYYKVAYINQLKILEASRDEKLYWLAIGLSSQSLSVLSVDDKIKILKYLIKNKLSDNFERLHDEELVVNIVASFNATNINEIDSFLEKFLIEYDSDTHQTLYEVLYLKMSKSTNFKEGLLGLSNWVLGTNFKPTSTRSQFVQILYALWQFSKYYPYNDDGTIKANTIGFKNVNGNSNFSNEEDYKNFLFLYSHNTAYSAEQITSLPDELIDQEFYTYKVIHEDASPMVIPYESEKEYGIFFDNFSFVINENKIKAYQEFETWGCSTSGAPNLTSPDYDKWINNHSDLCDVFYKSVRKINVLYGTYNLFQPVSLLNTNLETKTAIATVNGDSIIENGKNVNSFIPAFVLAHIDEEGDRSDIETMIGYAVDIALTFTAVGNLSKLRHLRWAAVGGESIGLISIEGLNLVIDTLTFTSQILNYISIIAGDCDENDDFCKGFKNFSNALNLLCLSLNAGRMVGVASIALTKQSFLLVESVRAGATTENLIKANIRARLLLSYANAPAQIVDGFVENLYSLYRRGANIYSNPLGPVLNLTFGIYKFAKIIFDKISLILIKQQNKLYGILEDIAVGTETTRPPRFSLFKYDKIVRKVKGYDMTFYTRTNQLVHTEQEFCEIIRKGKALGLKDELITSFVLKSYRVAKPKTYEQVIGFMEKYNEFSTTRGSVPFCFGSATHLSSFNSYLINLLKKYKLEENLDEFQISGSALYQDIVPDLDLGGYTFADKLKKIYLESGNTFIENKELIARLLKRKYSLSADPKAAQNTFLRLEKFYKPLEEAKGNLNKINSIPLDKISSNNIIRLEGSGNNIKFHMLSDELFQIKHNNAIKPNLNQGGKFKIDFNIFVKGENGRRLQPDLTIKIN